MNGRENSTSPPQDNPPGPQKAMPPVIPPSLPASPKPARRGSPRLVFATAVLGLLVLGGVSVLVWYLGEKSLSVEAPKAKAGPGAKTNQVKRARVPSPLESTQRAVDGSETIAPSQVGAGRWVLCQVEPLARIMHSAVWTGKEMIIWGGGAQNRFLNDGAAYDPSTGEWRETSAAHGLSPRWGHAAVWTGQEMLVWGGRGAFAPAVHKGDGARYDPATDTWKPMSTEGAPAPRSQPAVVWTGEEMIIWGGIGDGDTAFIDGARYNPTTDRWTPIATNGAPAGRISCASIWTGTELVVWGGLSGCQNIRLVAGGARYSPKLDRWEAISETGAPTPRSMPGAVWTGKEMILSGGVTELSPLSTPCREVYRYDPAQNTWISLTNVPALAQRQSHSATWTGSEMILWGGRGARGALLRTGVRYEPGTGEWLPTAVAGAPSARLSHSAVWTGDSLLVFGGFTGGSVALRTLHAYFPAAAHPAERAVEETIPEPVPGVYRPSEMFLGKSNPSGVWSAGWASRIGGEFTPLKTYGMQQGREGAGIVSWQLSRQETPSVFCNTNRHRVENIPPMAVWLFPGQDERPENYGVIRFTAPENAQYRIQCPTRGFYGDRAPGGDTDFHVAHNGQEIFGQFLPRAGLSRFGTNLNLKAGDTVDFVIGRGQDRRAQGSALFLDASVTKLP